MNKVRTFVLVALTFFICSGAKATGWTTPATVSYLHTFPQAFSFSLTGISTGCSGGSNQVFIAWSASDATTLYALVLAAYQTGDLLAVNIADCNSPIASSGAESSDIDVRHP